MKKFLFFVVATFVCSTVGAQVVTSTSFKRAKSGTVWYLKAGMNLSKMESDGESSDSKMGYNVGIAFDRPIAGSGVFWNSGLLLATKGWKYEESGYEASLIAHKLEIPLTFGYKFKASEDITVDARVGGFANFDLFGTYKEDDESCSLSDLDDLEGYDRFSAGVQFGVGVWYQKLNLNITYQNGLVDQNEAKERNWMISLGYAF